MIRDLTSFRTVANCEKVQLLSSCLARKCRKSITRFPLLAQRAAIFSTIDETEQRADDHNSVDLRILNDRWPRV